MTVDIDRLRVGMEVVYLHPENGWPLDQQRATQALEEGRVYRVAAFKVDDWRTDLYLKEVGSGPFNSVQFEEAES